MTEGTSFDYNINNRLLVQTSAYLSSFHPSMKYSVQLPSEIWWSNAIFFVIVHLAALAGFIYNPVWEARRATLVMAFLIWQLADFGSVIIYASLSASHSLAELPLATTVSTHTGHSAHLSPSALCWQFWGHRHSRDPSRCAVHLFV